MPRVLALLELAFSLWLVVDAIRRGAAYYWYPIIMLPFGEWIYFFTIKIHDPEFEWARELHRKLTTKKVTVEQLRYQASQSPSFANQLALAQALYDAGVYGEAAERFAAAIEMHDDSREAVYGLALTRSALADYERAIDGFRRVIALDPSFRDYDAYSDLADALCQSGRMAEVHELLEGLVTRSPRLRHRVLHAHYLLHDGRRDEAREQLTAGLAEYDHAPKYVKRKNRAWRRRAQQLLEQL
ncbi:MAG: hypothetical protein GY719_30940 [bacterium]|nr:hypothetical protein [bacterium]